MLAMFFFRFIIQKKLFDEYSYAIPYCQSIFQNVSLKIKSQQGHTPRVLPKFSSTTRRAGVLRPHRLSHRWASGAGAMRETRWEA